MDMSPRSALTFALQTMQAATTTCNEDNEAQLIWNTCIELLNKKRTKSAYLKIIELIRPHFHDQTHALEYAMRKGTIDQVIDTLFFNIEYVVETKVTKTEKSRHASVKKEYREERATLTEFPLQCIENNSKEEHIGIFRMSL